ncbi:hypothetical protein CLU93_4839 [Janthinobacterium sp. 35]|nr:hypothetical protein CLU93_4839 [Janthinobacterium sp. 35]
MFVPSLSTRAEMASTFIAFKIVPVNARKGRLLRKTGKTCNVRFRPKAAGGIFNGFLFCYRNWTFDANSLEVFAIYF